MGELSTRHAFALPEALLNELNQHLVSRLGITRPNIRERRFS
jgi:hypothetical protein